jgi:broad specificity phosphatase PhoE
MYRKGRWKLQMILAKKLNLHVQLSAAWRETNNGFLAGMPNSEAEEKYPGLYFSSLEMDEKYPGGESPIKNFKRIKHIFESLCNEIQLLILVSIK